MRETCHIFRKNGEDFVSFEVAKIRTKQALASTFHTLQETPEFSRSASEQHPGDLFSMSCYRLHVLYALNQGSSLYAISVRKPRKVYLVGEETHLDGSLQDRVWTEPA